MLEAIVKELAAKLICETHPNVCALRDSDPEALVSKVTAIITSSPTSISIQTAFAVIETETE